MQPDLARLFELQQVDTAIAEAEADLAALDDGTAKARELATAEAELADRQKALAKDEAALRDRELQSKTTETKLERCKERAYGGTVTNQRELQGLELEIEALGRATDRLDTAVLELYEAVEDKQAGANEQEAAVHRIARELETIRNTYSSEKQRLEGELSRLRGERIGLTDEIQDSILARYDRIRARSNNLGIVAVANGVCTGCNVTMPRVVMQRLETVGGEEFCESCKRYLYLPE